MPHVLVAWSNGTDLFLERIKGNKAWIWRHISHGTYEEALDEVKNSGMFIAAEFFTGRGE